jgi:nucleoside-triphosphatase THEP1
MPPHFASSYRLLGDPTPGVTLLSGPPGSGKTSHLVGYANRLSEAGTRVFAVFPEGVPSNQLPHLLSSNLSVYMGDFNPARFFEMFRQAASKGDVLIFDALDTVEVSEEKTLKEVLESFKHRALEGDFSIIVSMTRRLSPPKDPDSVVVLPTLIEQGVITRQVALP